MSRLAVTFSPAANRDLAAILGVIAENVGSRTAARWNKTFRERAAVLAEQPLIGAVDDDLGPGRRRLVVPPYLIVYRPLLAEVIILRIVHGARDLRTLFNDLP